MTAPARTPIRLATPDDTGALLGLQNALDRESEFMLLEPGERSAAATVPAGPSYMMVAEGNGELSGYVEVSVLRFARAARTGYLVMGVLAAYAGQCLGRALLEQAREEAVARRLRRLELTVMTHNRRALNLYLACGFEVEGLRRDALVVDGVVRSEYYMGRLL